MDMTGVELLVANTHLQVQHLEDDVIQGLKERIETSEDGIQTWRGIFSRKVDSLELERDRVEANCATTREVLSSWMVSFEALEKSIADEST